MKKCIECGKTETKEFYEDSKGDVCCEKCLNIMLSKLRYIANGGQK